MIVNCWRRFLLVFELPTLRQLYFNESLWPLEKVLDKLYHSLRGILSNTTWAQWGLINKLPGNAFGAVTRIRPKKKYCDNDNITFGAVNQDKTKSYCIWLLYRWLCPEYSTTNGTGNRTKHSITVLFSEWRESAIFFFMIQIVDLCIYQGLSKSNATQWDF